MDADLSCASVRKELRVRPGFVPTEDVAKYKVGGGSIRTQHMAAQANFQAPTSSSPVSVRDETPRRPNPSDFVPREKPVYPAASLSKPTRAGASSSRWAFAPVEAVPAEKPAVLKPTRGRGGRQRGSGRGGKAPILTSLDVLAAARSPDLGGTSAAETESVASAVQHAASAGQDTSEPAKDPLSLSMDWPDDSPGGEWWQDEPEDVDVASAAEALRGVSINDRQPPFAPIEAQETGLNSEVSSSSPKAGRADRKATTSEPHNGKGRPGKAPDVMSRRSPPKQPSAEVTNTNSLLNRMEPRSREQAAAQTPDHVIPPVPLAEASGPSDARSKIWKLSLQEARDRSTKLTAELRQVRCQPVLS